MKKDSVNEFMVQPAEIAVKVPAAVKRIKYEKVYGLPVPVVELIYKPDSDRSRRMVIKSSATAYAVFKDHWDMNKIELVREFKVLLMTMSNRVLGIYSIGSGGISSVHIDPKIIFSAAILAGAAHVIFAINKVSGNLTPSASELDMNNRLKKIADLFGIDVLDFIILGPEGFLSFADYGIITTEE